MVQVIPVMLLHASCPVYLMHSYGNDINIAYIELSVTLLTLRNENHDNGKKSIPTYCLFYIHDCFYE